MVDQNVAAIAGRPAGATDDDLQVLVHLDPVGARGRHRKAVCGRAPGTAATADALGEDADRVRLAGVDRAGIGDDHVAGIVARSTIAADREAEGVVVLVGVFVRIVRIGRRSAGLQIECNRVRRATPAAAATDALGHNAVRADAEGVDVAGVTDRDVASGIAVAATATDGNRSIHDTAFAIGSRRDRAGVTGRAEAAAATDALGIYRVGLGTEGCDVAGVVHGDLGRSAPCAALAADGQIDVGSAVLAARTVGGRDGHPPVATTPANALRHDAVGEQLLLTRLHRAVVQVSCQDRSGVGDLDLTGVPRDGACASDRNPDVLTISRAYGGGDAQASIAAAPADALREDGIRTAARDHDVGTVVNDHFSGVGAGPAISAHANLDTPRLAATRGCARHGKSAVTATAADALGQQPVGLIPGRRDHAGRRYRHRRCGIAAATAAADRNAEGIGRRR